MKTRISNEKIAALALCLSLNFAVAVVNPGQAAEGTGEKPEKTATPAVPDAADTGALLQEIASAWKKHTGYEVDDERVTQIEQVTMKTKGHLKAMPASHKYIHDTMTETNLGFKDLPGRVVCDGVTIYDEHSFPGLGTKLEKGILKWKLKDRPGDEPKLNLNDFKDVFGFAYDFKSSREESVNGEVMYVFSGVSKPKEGKALPSVPGVTWPANDAKMTCTAYVAKSDLLLRKIEIVNDKKETIETVTYTNMKHDAALEDSQFAYSPPAGVTVTDIDDLKAKQATK
jgi:outer membrane lipoprotein-sorting protein